MWLSHNCIVTMAGIFDIELHDGDNVDQDESDDDIIDAIPVIFLKIIIVPRNLIKKTIRIFFFCKNLCKILRVCVSSYHEVLCSASSRLFSFLFFFVYNARKKLFWFNFSGAVRHSTERQWSCWVSLWGNNNWWCIRPGQYLVGWPEKKAEEFENWKKKSCGYW